MRYAVMFTAIALTALSVQANPTQVSNGVMASKEGKTLYIVRQGRCGQKQLQRRLRGRVASFHRCQPGAGRR